MFNLKYTIMACITLCNLEVASNDSCETQWRLQINKLSLMRKKLSRSVTKDKSDLYQLKTSN